MFKVGEGYARDLLEAALDQPQPTKRLKRIIQKILTHIHHDDRFQLKADPREP